MAVAGADGAAVAAQPVEVVRFGSECNYSARTDTEHNKRIVKGIGLLYIKPADQLCQSVSV